MPTKLTFEGGRPVDASDTCPNCESPVIDEWEYCPFCGVAL